eukprot:CAMPEP_0169193098 /NCGR_PEP_ID=MMETSP1016-20121227/5980_1 /TAXON_ID=342587 /ORGANISM="Karlodinium micrum, Strain CCMP2283" /LENGTH=846 /DNA_ID=CAMNT_0009269509 /DNA_START=7 /DNA_END=2543 /DNA_ORIENTATION=-
MAPENMLSNMETIMQHGASGRLDLSLQHLKVSLTGSLRDDVFLYSKAMKVCGDLKNWRKALELLNEMVQNGIKPNLVCYNTVIAACVKNKEGNAALRIVYHLLEKGVKLDHYTCSSALKAFAMVNDWEGALTFFDGMEARIGVVPNAHCYSAAINACEKGGQWQRALELFHTMQSQNVKPTSITCTSVICACRSAGQWEAALTVLRQMGPMGVSPDVHTYSAIISACDKAGKWQEAIQLFDELLNSSLTPTLVCYGAVLRACDIGRQWQTALRIFYSMSITPDHIVYHSVISACCKSNRVQECLDVLRKLLESGVTPDRRLLGMVFTTCAREGKISEVEELLGAAPRDYIKACPYDTSRVYNRACPRGEQDSPDKAGSKATTKKGLPRNQGAQETAQCRQLEHKVSGNEEVSREVGNKVKLDKTTACGKDVGFWQKAQHEGCNGKDEMHRMLLQEMATSQAKRSAQDHGMTAQTESRTRELRAREGQVVEIKLGDFLDPQGSAQTLKGQKKQLDPGHVESTIKAHLALTGCQEVCISVPPGLPPPGVWADAVAALKARDTSGMNASAPEFVPASGLGDSTVVYRPTYSIGRPSLSRGVVVPTPCIKKELNADAIEFIPGTAPVQSVTLEDTCCNVSLLSRAVDIPRTPFRTSFSASAKEFVPSVVEVAAALPLHSCNLEDSCSKVVTKADACNSVTGLNEPTYSDWQRHVLEKLSIPSSEQTTNACADEHSTIFASDVSETSSDPQEAQMPADVTAADLCTMVEEPFDIGEASKMLQELINDAENLGDEEVAFINDRLSAFAKAGFCDAALDILARMDKAELMVSVSGIADVANACEWAGHDNEAR